ncbi:hypothetical protein L4174_023825 (plasmid) [Photobacterium sp. CCB-ST2H9]|uniref:hypothetical protein n=1 Tax=Photobacterium sp. CCB-ST2H9 TaxID=2912855 RepID=UPI0020050A42|nr:hypothetical protein [Photobacterium sp. CCB-ST2H9]UTM60416.1 hypothetical protein L4174_023825 [Photobacterium sp. CCB-ST2H9]
MSIFSPGGEQPLFQQMLFESVLVKDNEELPPPAEQEVTEKVFFESLSEDAIYEAVSTNAKISMRSDAAAAVIIWTEEGDSEFDSFEALAYGLAGGVDGEELNEDQLDEFETFLNLMADFCQQVGASSDDVQAMIDGDDDAAEKVFEAVSSLADNVSTDELIADFAAKESLILESTKRVIRDGKFVFKKVKRKRRMTSAQKAALKQAQKKSHSSAAKAKREKSMRMRKSRNL